MTTIGWKAVPEAESYDIYSGTWADDMFLGYAREAREHRERELRLGWLGRFWRDLGALLFGWLGQ